MNNQIPKNWQTVKLRDIVNVYGGGTPSTQESSFWDGNIPWLTPSELTNSDSRFTAGTSSYITPAGLQNSSARIMPENSILLTSRATIGNATINNVPMTTNQGFINIEPKKVDRDFFFYWIKNKREYLNQIAIGSTFPELSKSVFKEIETAIPSDKNYQHKIGKFLSDFDEKIDVNNKIAKTLEEIAQALFKEWFINFKFPGYKKTEFVDNEIGKIPRGWAAQNIGDICETFGGGTPSTNNEAYWRDGTINWATPTDMTSLSGPFIFDTEKKITDVGLKNSSTKLLPIDSILITSRATVGILAISKISICTNQGFIAIFCSDYPSHYFMFCLIKNRLGQIRSLATGSTFPEISKGVFRKITVILPDKDTVLKFDQIVKPMFEEIAVTMLENQKLTTLRDLFLPKLMKGEIRI